MSVATFRAPSLQAQLTELKREKEKRASVYPMLVAKGTLSKQAADYQNRGLDGAIATLSRLVAAELRGEPGRKELVDALKLARVRLFDNAVPTDFLDTLLARIKE